jgi:predicted DNA-binding protein (UPF0251 family)
VPCCKCFNPQGSGSTDREVQLFRDELEAIKLYDLDGLDQKTAAKRMNISQPTFGRVLATAREKIARAIVKGEKLNIEPKDN